ncbi:hypothetical protein QA640_03055 [Bradyrhizobium sp. CB82]|uniref:hypothetical protein n=1 Tax=Bradyrhizobium sp. CB82 TaxID=3039159 RepID=UPI0024B04FB3|nr:hypothetical protein [Bradyrhizobium sp. CB82]WFU41525.1 hypothetical protein QA640_03055 [Bradyrhizobium sp. CB82]
MKFYTPEKGVLMEVTSLERHPDGLLLKGKIMGTMPMKAILRPEEARAIFGLLNFKTCISLVAILFRGLLTKPSGVQRVS